MKSLGVKFTINHLYYALVEGTGDTPALVSKDDVMIPSDLLPGEYTDWVETQLALIMDKTGANRISYKLTRTLDTHVQIFHVYFGLAILVNLAYRRGVKCSHVTPASLRPASPGRAKQKAVDEYVNGLFGTRERPWNSGVREAVALAIMGLHRDDT